MDSNEITERAAAAKRKTRRDWYEAEIERRGRSLQSIFVEMGNDPLKPWIDTHETFEAYCEERWNVSPRRIQQIKKGESVKALMAAEAPDLAPTIARMKEGQVRVLATAPPDKRVAILREATKAPKLDAPAIKDAKARVIATEENPERELPEEPSFDDDEPEQSTWHFESDAYVENLAGGYSARSLPNLVETLIAQGATSITLKLAK